MGLKEQVLSALIIILIAILAFSDRPWMGGTRLTVSRLAEIKLPEKFGDADNTVFRLGVHIPHPSSKAQDLLAALGGGVQSRGEATTPALGYLVKEYTFLGMPIFFLPEAGGYSVYTHDSRELIAMPLSDYGLQLVNAANRRDVRDGVIIPFWNHLWGWLFVAGVGLWGWLQYRHIAKWRAETGIM